MKIFSKKKYVEYTSLFGHYEWAKMADGKEVKNGYVVGTALGVVDDWCVDTAPLMERFKREKIAVNVGEGEHLDTFLEMCEEAGLEWNGGDNATGFKPHGCYGARTCIAYKMEHCDFCIEDGLGYSPKEFYEENGYNVIDFIDFINLDVEDVEEKTAEKPRYKITITCKGATTTAAFEVNGKTVKTATAKCNLVDKFNFHTGAELAFDRLFEKQHKALDLHNLKAGDKVRVRKDLEANKSYGNDCAVKEMLEYCGKVVTISEVLENGKYRIAEGIWYWTPKMFENI